MQDIVDVGQLSTDELVPHIAVQLSIVRPDRVRDGIAPLRATDEHVAGRLRQRTELVFLDDWRRNVTPSNTAQSNHHDITTYSYPALLFLHPICFQPLPVNLVVLLLCRPITSQFYYYLQHYVPCIFIFNVSHSLHLNSYSFVIVLTYIAYCVYCCFYHCIMYLSIQLQSCQSVYNKLTYLLTYTVRTADCMRVHVTVMLKWWH